MLFDVLGILIAFSGVMLLLSLLVTAMGQLTQHCLHLRQKNLQFGLARLLEAASDKVGGKKIDADKAKLLAEKIILLCNPLIRGAKEGKRWWFSSTDTWVKDTEFSAALSELKGEGDDAPVTKEIAAAADRLFPSMEPRSCARFAYAMRYVTVFWSIAIAVVFQMSAPHLLQRLSRDKAFLARNFDLSTRLVSGESKLSDGQYRDIAVEALDDLAVRYPDLRPALEEVSGVGDDKDALIHELRLVVAKDTRAQAIVRDYELFLDERQKKRIDKAREDVDATLTQLAMLDVHPWPNSANDFYFCGWKGAKNCAGVFVTTILLTLGAPFWFNAIKNLSTLRDLVAPKQENR